MNLKSLALFIFLPLLTNAQAYKLWYKKPAEKWTDALPIGNGRLGAMVFGGVEKDRIQFNEETLWSGEPRNYNHLDAAKYLGKIRQLLQEGKQKEAEQLAEEKFMGTKSNEGKREEWLAAIRQLKGFVGNPATENFDDSAWKTIKVPTYEGWETIGFEGLDGALWFRTTFDLPENWKGKNLILDLNRVRDQDFTYINGKLIGNTNNIDVRKYVIPAGLLKVGKNSIVIQVINYFDKGGIAGYKDTTRHIGIYPANENGEQRISLVKDWKYFIQNDEPPVFGKYQADYQPFGDLFLDFKNVQNFSNYSRELSLSEAIVRTIYTSKGIQFTREYFASEPDQAIVIHLSASQLKSISFEASFSSPHKKYVVRQLDKHTLSLSVAVRNGVLKGESNLLIQAKNGEISTENNKISVENADEVNLYLVAATNFIDYKNTSGNPVAICQQRLANIQKSKLTNAQNFAKIKQKHLKEYQRYYNTFSIDFGKDKYDNLPTDERIQQFQHHSDPSFAALYVQYGRYLLISSSRLGTHPANLQGIWNDLLTPPWGSKYTTNINAEMNYWPAEVLNLSPMHESLFKMIEELAKNGKETAKTHYDARGWLVHHNTDIWRGTAPINASNHGIWVSGGGWLSQHLWEHYLFTQDKNFLKNKAYPIMKGAAEFFVDFLVKDPKTGWLISTPANSPENGGLVAGATMDHQIIRNLFKNCIEASKVLHLDKKFRDTLLMKYNQIAPNQIGKYGQLQEWLEDKDDTTNKHRHVSHLWGVHPGNDITWEESPEIMKAARQSLIYRGDEGTGWSLAWKINFWARFKDGDHAMKMVKMLIRPASGAGGSYVNLFDAHPPFQIDGNFGGSAGIAEMLLQSHTKYIDIFPALPTDLQEGSVKGIKARGGFELDFTWKNGKLTKLKIFSKAGEHCYLRYRRQEIDFQTTKGKVYTFNGELK